MAKAFREGYMLKEGEEVKYLTRALYEEHTVDFVVQDLRLLC